MTEQLIKKATNEELLEMLQGNIQYLNKTEVFTKEYRECFFEIKQIKEEILNRMK